MLVSAVVSLLAKRHQQQFRFHYPSNTISTWFSFPLTILTSWVYSLWFGEEIVMVVMPLRISSIVQGWCPHQSFHN